MALCLGALLVAGSTALPSTPVAAAASARKVSAWLPYWDSEASTSFLNNADLYAELSPFWYEFSASGTITRYAGAEDATLVSTAKSKGVAVIPTISNAFDGARVHTMLSTSANRTAHVNAIMNVVTTNGYDGFDVDYENLQATDRDAFSSFVSQLASALHAQGKKLTVAVHPKTSEPGTWDGPKAQNYAAIGQAADKVRVMAYDYHWDSSAPGAIAPVSWVDQVAQFSASQIAPAKVELGIPLYGYDWVGSSGTGQVWSDVEALRTTYGATRQWSTTDLAPWFTYVAGGTTHTVWYEDAQSVDPKLAIVDKYGLAGAVFWRLGHEDSAVWTKVRTRWASTSDVVAPTKPTGLSAVAGKNSASLKWTASTDTGGSGLAGYDVYRAKKKAGPYAKIASPTAASFADSGLTAGATYWYYVQARDGANNLSIASAKVSVVSK
jgi:spore germination protein YaaH